MLFLQNHLRIGSSNTSYQRCDVQEESNKASLACISGLSSFRFFLYFSNEPFNVRQIQFSKNITLNV